LFKHILRLLNSSSHMNRSFALSQRARFKAIEYLRNGKERTVVVCTDVAARGLDIPSVASVVHYDVARTVDSFVHRSGRTAVRVLYSLCLSAYEKEER
jgi:ATP-dependent RNA helicase DDX24/MAK5